MVSRRDFLIQSSAGLLSSLLPFSAHASKIEKIIANEFQTLRTPDYETVSHKPIEWKNIGDGLDFSRIEIYRNNTLVDVIATVKADPKKNRLELFNGFDNKNSLALTIEDWQKITNAQVMINSAQYSADPYYMPCALFMGKKVSIDQRGSLNFSQELIGPKFNKSVTGMLVGEPTRNSNLSLIDLLDFEYDKFDYKTTPYTQGVQHWMILLDRNEKIKVKKSLWQANRTVVAKTKDEQLLFMTTEGGYFTLYNMGQFFRDSNRRKDKGFNIHTAMNMDGGYEANMIIKNPKLEYVTYGEFETYGPGRDATVFNRKIRIPGVIGLFPRE